MSFIGIKYLAFFTVVVALFFALPYRFRWIFLLVTSYMFYMIWDPKYALILLAVTVIVYVTALLMHNKSQRIKKILVALSVVSNLSILFAFKYYNFFSDSLKDLFAFLGTNYNAPIMTLILPVGISFYTFQAIGYTIDVYRGTREPERHFGMFALYVSFFPVILSGPIERSTHLLPQLYKKIEFDYMRVTNGLMLMAWGFFQKIVIADRISVYANLVYNNLPMVKGLPLVAATYFFLFQIFCDFSGYTDIAIGTAQVMGYELLPNFRRPFFANSIGELWRRWHMSLISWIRDYLYIPLGGSRVPKYRYYFNILLVFTMSGLWHGASWPFVMWGFINGFFIGASRVTARVREFVREKIFGAIGKTPALVYFALCVACVALVTLGGMIGVKLGGKIGIGFAGAFMLGMGILKVRGGAYDTFVIKLKRWWMVFVTFQLFAAGAVFFKAKTMAEAWYVYKNFPGTNFLHLLLFFKPVDFLIMILSVVFLLIVHHVQETRGSIRQIVRTKPLIVRWILYYVFIMTIFMSITGASQFEYFRF